LSQLCNNGTRSEEIQTARRQIHACESNGVLLNAALLLATMGSSNPIRRGRMASRGVRIRTAMVLIALLAIVLAGVISVRRQRWRKNAELAAHLAQLSQVHEVQSAHYTRAAQIAKDSTPVNGDEFDRAILGQVSDLQSRALWHAQQAREYRAQSHELRLCW
jgi:hypothetical protein